MNLSVTTKRLGPTNAEIIKQIKFGTAKGLTDTAKEGQKAVVDALKDAFTLRGGWYNPNMKHGIKITPAKRDNLTAEVKTLADWLEMHEKGGTKLPRGNSVAVPTWQIRPKGSTKILRGPMRPKALLAAGKAFILDTEKGPVIARMKGKHNLEILYGLEPRVEIKKRSTFYEPLNKLVKSRVEANVTAGINYAFATMK